MTTLNSTSHTVNAIDASKANEALMCKGSDALLAILDWLAEQVEEHGLPEKTHQKAWDKAYEGYHALNEALAIVERYHRFYRPTQCEAILPTYSPPQWYIDGKKERGL